MSRLESKFQAFKKENKKALVIYITAGLPGDFSTKELVLDLEKAGADIIELGVPFSDPMADGPVIQEASYKAIKGGMTTAKVLEIVREIRKESQIPLAAMGYVNNMLSYGFEKFVKDSQEAGLDALIIPDVPHEEAGEMKALCSEHNIDLIEFVTPGTVARRISETCTTASGFIYCVSINGVTGVKKIDYTPISRVIEEVKKQTETPCAVGFGIGSPEAAVQAAQVADGVIVGSAVVKLLMEGKKDEALQLVREIRLALDRG